MKIRNAWNISQLPDAYVAELEDGTLKFFRITPFREIAEKDLKDYKGHHPRHCKGVPMPEYLYRFYGLERGESALSEVVRVRMSPEQKGKLDAAGAPSTVIRRLIDENL